MIKIRIVFILLVSLLSSHNIFSFRIPQSRMVRKSVDFAKIKEKEVDINHQIFEMTGGNNQKLVTEITIYSKILAAWGVLGVVSVILNALKRLIPIAIQPFLQKDILPWQWMSYGVWIVYMIYVEGYKAFYLSFAPFIVKRAMLLHESPNILKYIFAGPYCMGLFSAQKRRLIISWAITIGVFGLVNVVKYLPYPYRSIVDGGVVAGLSVGTLSILFHFVMALLGKIPDIDPSIPLL
jgi:hypothetical protein